MPFMRRILPYFARQWYLVVKGARCIGDIHESNVDGMSISNKMAVLQRNPTEIQPHPLFDVM